MGCGASTAANAAPIGAGGEPLPDPQTLIGKTIVIQGLERREDLNGLEATVDHYIEQRQRFICRVTNDTNETISIAADKVQAQLKK